MPKLKSGRETGVSFQPYLDGLNNPSIDNIYATPGHFRFAIKCPMDFLKYASIVECDDLGNIVVTNFLVKDLDSLEMGWTADETLEFKSWLGSEKRMEQWLCDFYEKAQAIVDPRATHTIVLSGSPEKEDEVSSDFSERKELISKYNISCFFHFTDERNLDLIRREGGILSLKELRLRGISPPAPGGNEWSHEADARVGLDGYVHLCFMDQHPMEFVARCSHRIGATRFLQIDPSIIFSDEVLFSADVSNKAGVRTLTFEEAVKEMDFSVIYGRPDWRDREICDRRRLASKYEILVPRIIPLSHILGV